MNVWILNHYATTPDNAGGTRHFDFAKQLVTQGYKVSLFASAFRHRVKKDIERSGKHNGIKEEVDGVSIYWIRTFSYKTNNWRRILNMLSYSISLLIIGVTSRDFPDTILASSPHPFTGVIGWLLAKFKNSKFV